MTYRLVVVTDGRGLLADTLASFVANVSPAPVDVLVHCDGRAALEEAQAVLPEVALPKWRLVGGRTRVGFCESTETAWVAATRIPLDGRLYPEYVFWLEDDFRFLRAVAVDQLAGILRGHPSLAQVALCRTAANSAEEAAGGLVESRPGEFAPIAGVPPWMMQQSYFTTNPSLMRRQLMIVHPFREGPECEGHHGVALREANYSFGLMGSGEPWVEHVGVRVGSGY